MPYPSATAYTAALGVGLDDDSAKTAQGRLYHKRSHYQAYKDKGFKHLRIRVVDDLSPALITDIKEAIDDALAVGLLPILAYGGGELETAVTPENYAKSVGWWKEIAPLFADYDNRLAFNLLIEIGSALSQNRATINQYYADVIGFIRSIGQIDRVIFCAPSLLSDPRKLKFLTLPSPAVDPFVAAEIHDYAAGAKKWVVPDDFTPLPFGTPHGLPLHVADARYWNDSDVGMRLANRDRIRATIAVATAWRQQTGIPVYWGAILATNPNNNNAWIGGDYTVEEQAVFAAFVVAEMAAAGIPVAWNSDSKFFQRELDQWIAEQTPVVDAIVGA